jgi:CHAD domain-containing protein
MEPEYVKLKEIKPALAGYIAEAKFIINNSELPPDKVIHDVRVLMKKARSVLRLIDHQIDTDFVKRENMALREVGRIISDTRDTTVLRKTLRDLRKKNPDVFSGLKDNEKICDLMKKPVRSADRSADDKTVQDRVNTILNKSAYRIRFEPMSNFDPQLLIKELDVTYRKVANYFMLCRNYPRPSRMHELRKVSKDFLYQLWFFRSLNVSAVKSIEKKLDIITGNLGKYNDLTQLIKKLGYRYEYTANSPALDELVLIIRDEQEKYLSKVWPVAYKIFCPGTRLENLLGYKILVI